jgi:hypothetical protein
LRSNLNAEKMSTDHRSDQNIVLKELSFADPETVLETLDGLRESGKVTDIPVLIELMNRTQNPEIKSKIAGLFGNLKEKEAVPLMIEAIQNPKYTSILKELVSSCWENGLNFSQYFSVFVDLLIGNDLIISFEAYTVIMNNEHRIDPEIIDLQIERLEKTLPTISEQKRPLILDVIDFLPSIRT